MVSMEERKVEATNEVNSRAKDKKVFENSFKRNLFVSKRGLLAFH